jgi:DNA-binding beta-propeller fold protein YncE
VIDTTTDKRVATIALSGKPEAAVADGKGMMFVDIEDKNEMMVIDTKKAAVVATWALPGCNEPAGLAMDEKTRRLFVGCHNKQLLVVNADNGKVVATLPIGEGVDANAFDADKNLIFSSQGDGTMTILKQESAEKYSVVQTATTQRYARTMAHNPISHDVYLVTAEFDQLPPAEGQSRPQRKMRPDSFTLLVMSEKR